MAVVCPAGIMADVLRALILLSSTGLVLGLDTEVPVAGFQLDGKSIKESYLFLKDEYVLDISKSFSICFWFKLHFMNGAARSISSIVNTVVKGTNDNALMIFLETSSMHEIVARASYKVDGLHSLVSKIDLLGHFRFMQWHHLCWVLNKQGSSVTSTLTIDGAKEATVHVTDHKDPDGPTTPMAFYVGQEQDDYNDIEAFDLIQSFSGEIAELGIWSRAIDNSTVQALSQCNMRVADAQDQLIVGPVNSSDYKEGNVTWKSLPLKQLCEPDPVKDQMLWLWPTSYTTFMPLCDLVRGRLPSADSTAELRSILDKTATLLPVMHDEDFPITGKEDPAIISGIRWSVEKHHYYNVYTGSSLDDLVIYNNFDADKDTEAVVAYWYRSYETFTPDFVFGEGYCHLQEENYLRIRGLCSQIQIEGGDGKIDDEFYIYGTNYGLPKFRGPKRSEILYSKELMTWTLRSTHSSKHFKKTQSNDLLPIGTKEWISSRKVCGGDVTKLNLTFTMCKNHEFTCDSGQCIDLSKRCDGHSDCGDVTDEVDCSYIRFDQTYIKHVAPIGHDYEPVDVHVTFTIQDLPDIDTFNLKYTINFNIEMSWKDPRLTFSDLNENDLSNQLSVKDRESIWIPKLMFLNSLSSAQTFVDNLSTNYIKRDGTPRLAPLAESKEAYLFSGNESKLVTTREYFHDFTCNYKLEYYPFDTQICKMRFEASAEVGKSIRLLNGGNDSTVQFLSSKHKMEYEICTIYTEFYRRPDNNFSQVSVIIKFRRRMEYHVFNTVLQTFFLKAIGLLTLFFDVHNFTDRIMVTLTTMLVIATISTSIQENLPKTSYYKLMDYWLMFCFNLHIFTMIIHTLIARLLQRENKVGDMSTDKMYPSGRNEAFARKVNFCGLVVFVVISLAFHAIFWSIALKEYYY